MKTELRPLEEKDRARVMALLSQDPEYNLFLISDLENHGFTTDFQQVWGGFDQTGAVAAVVLRYFENFVVYFQDAVWAAPVAALVTADERYVRVMGRTGVVDALCAEGLPVGKLRHLQLARLRTADALRADGLPDVPVEQLTGADIDDVLALHAQIPEFDEAANQRLTLTNNLQTNTGRGFLIRHGGRVVATALTSAENRYAALVMGVASHPDCRGQGLAAACLAHLCRELLAEGRSLCLYYDNPAAGAIYHQLGFETTGTWALGFR